MNGIADLDVGTLFLGLLGEHGGGHGCAVNAVAAGFRSDVNHRIADAGGAAVENFVVAEDAQREDVDQRIAVIAGLEDAFAADGGHAEAIAVMRDAADYAFEDSAVTISPGRIVERAETDGVEDGDGARAHGEDVAQDAADAGGRALEGLDETGVVVGFDLEGDGVAYAFRVLTDVDDAGVFAGADQHARALGGQLLQMQAGAFVGAVLAPHDREDADFGWIRLAAEDGADFGELRIGEAHAVRLAREDGIGNFSLAKARVLARAANGVRVDHERIASRLLLHRFAHLGQLVACRAEPLLGLYFSLSIGMVGHAHLPETLADDVLREFLDSGNMRKDCAALRAPGELLVDGDRGQEHVAIAGVMLLGVQGKAIPKGGKKGVGDLPQGIAGVFAVTDFYPAHGNTSIVADRPA